MMLDLSDRPSVYVVVEAWNLGYRIFVVPEGVHRKNLLLVHNSRPFCRVWSNILRLT